MEMSSFVNTIAQTAGSAVLAAVLLCLGAAILHADEARPLRPTEAGPAHCRMYFGCMPDLARTRGRLN